MSSRRITQVVLHATTELRIAGSSCADPHDHAFRILEAATGLGRTKLLVSPDDELSPEAFAKFETILRRRVAGEPLEYILERAYFWDFDVAVGPGVLIPRPETELLVEVFLARQPDAAVRVVELGAGSGVIGLAVLRERSQVRWVGIERSDAAFGYLQRNVAGAPRYETVAGDFFAEAPLRGPFDWLVANPPYVPSSDIPDLSEEVRREPKEALDGGSDGLDVFRHLLRDAPKYLRSGGGFLCEIDRAQADEAGVLCAAAGFEDFSVASDLAGLPRVVIAQRR